MAEAPDVAEEALAHGRASVRTNGQRYPAPLIEIVHADWQRLTGADPDEVRATLAGARRLIAAQEAHGMLPRVESVEARLAVRSK